MRRVRSFAVQVAVGAVVVAAWGAAALPATAAAQAASTVRAAAATASAVTAIPAPGSSSALPSTDIELRTARGAAGGATGESWSSVRLSVTGSRSGAHSGTVTAHPDGRGATFHPATPFTAGESVTVVSSRAVTVPVLETARASSAGSAAGVPQSATTWTFRVATPAAHPGTDRVGNILGTTAASEQARSDAALRAQASRRGVTPADQVTAVSRPDLRPPSLTVGSPASGTEAGLIFATPSDTAASSAGVMIYDDSGDLTYFRPIAGLVVGDAAVQTLNGVPVLTWFQGTAPYVAGNYRGAWEVADSTYRVVREIRMGNGLQADIHDLRITPQNTALMVAYNPVRCDGVAVTGCKTGAIVLDGVIQEVDIASGTVLFEWHALDHIAISDSYADPSAAILDYVHLNSLDLDSDGDILFSGRATSALTKIDRVTGAVQWIFGGKQNGFTIVGDQGSIQGPDFPHDFRSRGNGVYSYFDNGVRRNAADPSQTSRAAVFSIDTTAATATYTRILQHSPSVFAPTQGRMQQLADGHDFVAWGGTGLIDEFDASGASIFSAQLGAQTYRQVRQAWTGTPVENPSVAVTARNGSGVSLAVSWNGDTRTRRWQVLTGDSPDALSPAGTTTRKGFETTVQVPNAGAYVALRALDASGDALDYGTSTPVKAGSVFRERQSVSVGGTYTPLVGDFGGSRNDDVLYYAPGAAPDYLHIADGSGGFTSMPLPAVSGSYSPIVGDFVGDSRDEVLWRSASGPSFMWRFDRAARSSTPVVQSQSTVLPAGLTSAFVLTNRPNYGGGKDGIFCYKVGTGADQFVDFTWDAGKPLTQRVSSASVSGSYAPVVGDFDNNGWADILWYGAGDTPDFLWFVDRETTGQTAYRSQPAAITGSYTVRAGDFTGGAGADLLFDSPGAGADSLWTFDSAGVVTSSNVTRATSDTPTVLKGGRDSLLMWSGADLSKWVLSPFSVVQPTGNTAVGAGYQALVGDFVGAGGTSSVLFYAPGAQPELLYDGT